MREKREKRHANEAINNADEEEAKEEVDQRGVSGVRTYIGVYSHVGTLSCERRQVLGSAKATRKQECIKVRW